MVDTATRRWLIVAGLGTSQTLAWASSYYLIAILAPAMARDTGTSSMAVFAAFSASLLISALLGPRVGRTIDSIGGREVLAISNLVFAAGLGILAVAPSFPLLAVGWLVMGLGMGLGLYDAAFAALGRIYGHQARASITGITLLAGFASTVGWPLTAWGDATLGWRGTCAAWAIAHVAIGLPLNLLILPRLRHTTNTGAQAEAPHVPMDRAMWLLGFAFAAGWIVSTAMAAHLPRLLEAAGASTAQAIAAAALVGPAQVAARVLEAGLLSRYHPLVSARLSTLTHPVGAGLLLLGGGWLAAPFTLLHGAGNGILTIARGTVPLAVFGPENYGYRLGLIGAPARILQAGAPIAFGALIDHFGAYALLCSSGACVLATWALLAVQIAPQAVVENQGAER
ncbi:MAG: MFS transporter [Hyphomicrobiaceae bacterium]|nr:MFS transporter [Hyphomicrobiaceae bacterium]